MVDTGETYFKTSKKGDRNLNGAARQRGTNTYTYGINNIDWVSFLAKKDRNNLEFDQVLSHVSGTQINNYLAR